MGKRGGEYTGNKDGSGRPVKHMFSLKPPTKFDVDSRFADDKRLNLNENMEKELNINPDHVEAINAYLDNVLYARREWGMFFAEDGSKITELVRGNPGNMGRKFSNMADELTKERNDVIGVHYHPAINSYPSPQDIHFQAYYGMKTSYIASHGGVTKITLSDDLLNKVDGISKGDWSKLQGSITREWNKVQRGVIQTNIDKLEKEYIKKFGKDEYGFPNKVVTMYYEEDEMRNREFNKALEKVGITIEYGSFIDWKAEKSK